MPCIWYSCLYWTDHQSAIISVLDVLAINEPDIFDMLISVNGHVYPGSISTPLIGSRVLTKGSLLSTVMRNNRLDRVEFSFEEARVPFNGGCAAFKKIHTCT